MDGPFDQGVHLINCSQESSSNHHLDPLHIISLASDASALQDYLTMHPPITPNDMESQQQVGLEEEPHGGATYTILDQSMRELFYDDPHREGSKRVSYEVFSQHQLDQEEEDSRDSCLRKNNNSNNNTSDSDNGCEESNNNNNYLAPGKVDPFSEACKIPLPGSVMMGGSRVFVRRRNERERQRVRSVNDGFERLRSHLPSECDLKDRRLSKVETLRNAINYIKYLQELLDQDDDTSQ